MAMSCGTGLLHCYRSCPYLISPDRLYKPWSPLKNTPDSPWLYSVSPQAPSELWWVSRLTRLSTSSPSPSSPPGSSVSFHLPPLPHSGLGAGVGVGVGMPL